MDKIDKLMVMEAALMVCGDVLGKKVRKKLEAHLEKELNGEGDCLFRPEFSGYLQQQKAAIIKLSEAKEVFGYGI